MAKHQISNRDNIINSRDVIERISELEDELRANFEDDTAQGVIDDWIIEQAEVGNDEAAELHALRALAEEASGYAADWDHGESLIRESYFTEYCQDLLEGIGGIPKNIPSYIKIDWEETAKNLKVDHTEVDYGRVTYLIR